MKRWIVKLAGESTDLDELPFWFPNGNSFAFREDDGIYLASERFLPSCSVSEVFQLAEAILSEWHAVILLLWPPFLLPTIEYIISESTDGTRVRQAMVFSTLTIRPKTRATPSDLTGPTQAQEYLHAANSCAILAEVLALWALPNRTWFRLYRIMEELERHLNGSLASKGLCSKNQQERFKRSANTAEVAGADSRHASDQFPPPTNPMSLGEATSFMRDLITKCLSREKVKT